MKIIITGGTGFIGSKLSRELADTGHEVFVVDRRIPVVSGGTLNGITYYQADLLKDSIPEVFASVEAIIHLAGASIFKRWTPSYKQLIIDSRVKSANAIFEFLREREHSLKVFVSASAIGFYGDERGEEVLTESSSVGKDFLSEVCEKWESSGHQFSQIGARTVSVRTAIVLGPGGGMMSQILPLFKMFVGGKLGSGRQWFSWIHIDDLVRVYIEALENENLSGPVNASAPNPVRNSEFTKELAKALKRPAIFTVPAFALRIMLGEFSRAVLGSQKVLPTKLQAISFQFRKPDIGTALKDLV